MTESSNVNQERPEILFGRTIKIRAPFGPVFVTLNEDRNGKPCELFLNVGKCGSEVTADAEAIGRLCTLLLRMPSAIPEHERIRKIIHHLVGIAAESQNRPIRSVPDAVASALSIYLSSQTQILRTGSG